MMMSGKDGKPTEIPSKDDFDALSKLERKIFLETLRREFNDKEIREKWNLKPQSFYAIISRYGLGRQYRKNDDAEKRPPGRPPNKRPEEPADEPLMDVERERVVIDADYTVVPEAVVKEAKFNVGDVMEFPFPKIKGTPAQLRKQFEAVAMFLEGNESDDTSFEIRLSVVKK